MSVHVSVCPSRLERERGVLPRETGKVDRKEGGGYMMECQDEHTFPEQLWVTHLVESKGEQCNNNRVSPRDMIGLSLDLISVAMGV